MRFKSGLRLATICAMAFALPVFAHHSHGNYVDTFMDIEGAVKELHLVVPHSWIYLEVKDGNGELQMWALEATSRTGLQRIGVTPDYVKPGDQVTLAFDPATKTPVSFTVATYLDEPKDIVIMNACFSRLPDGTNFVEESVVDAKAKQVHVKKTNFGYQKVGG